MVPITRRLALGEKSLLKPRMVPVSACEHCPRKTSSFLQAAQLKTIMAAKSGHGPAREEGSEEGRTCF